MSIALERGAGIRGAEFVRSVGCVPIYESSEIEEGRGKDLPHKTSAECSPSSSSSSSIGKDSDDSGRGLQQDQDGGMGEVESTYKGPLQGMESLEESLPIRRSISNFYAGKSKSFTNFADAMSSCISAKDLGKTENAYSRRRRNLLASKAICERPYSINLLRSSGGGIAKRPLSSTRSSLALAVTMSGSPKRSNNAEDGNDQSILPPLHPPSKSSSTVGSPSRLQYPFPMRSFSFSDLPVITSSSFPMRVSDEKKGFSFDQH
ncbi:hypothetical protein AXF42_Ash005006 [Apostasia shenzhenica]|uniref:Uncharacterized protein n=1 Tax=Apostasia shenzhenica TaxID=1088818 RepID=A0A2I0B871_9ASPA|nr:hypothetical protein AXF42_Ash005006 [Apostasia shenzhenica]